MAKMTETQLAHARREAALRAMLESRRGHVRVFETATLSGYSRQTLWSWVKAGLLPEPQRIGVGGGKGWSAGVVSDLLDGTLFREWKKAS